MAVEIWTNSRLKAYQMCPMQEKYRYRDCLSPRGRREALNIGTAVHRGIERRSVEAALEALEFDFPADQAAYDAQEILRGTVKAMLKGYFAVYPPFEEHDPELGFEIGARFPTKGGLRRSNRIKLAGKIDDIATIDGRQWIVEYKTASQIDRSYFDRLYVDSQITFYMMAAMRCGFKPVGVIYRVLKKPQLRRRQGERVEAFIERMEQDYLLRPDFYFCEGRYFRSSADIAQFEKDVWHEIKQADLNAKDGRIYRHSHACSNYGACPYLPLCTGEAGAEMMFEYREPHEELDFLKGE